MSDERSAFPAVEQCKSPDNDDPAEDEFRKFDVGADRDADETRYDEGLDKSNQERPWRDVVVSHESPLFARLPAIDDERHRQDDNTGDNGFPSARGEPTLRKREQRCHQPEHNRLPCGEGTIVRFGHAPSVS